MFMPMLAAIFLEDHIVDVKNDSLIITLKANMFFIISVFSFIMFLALLTHMPYHNIWAYSFMVIYAVINLSSLKTTSHIYEIRKNKLTLYYFFGLLGKKNYYFNDLKELQYIENNNGTMTNFILIFSDKKIEIPSFFPHMSQAFTYIRFHYPELNLKKVKF